MWIYTSSFRYVWNTNNTLTHLIDQIKFVLLLSIHSMECISPMYPPSFSIQYHSCFAVKIDWIKFDENAGKLLLKDLTLLDFIAIEEVRSIIYLITEKWADWNENLFLLCFYTSSHTREKKTFIFLSYIVDKKIKSSNMHTFILVWKHIMKTVVKWNPLNMLYLLCTAS